MSSPPGEDDIQDLERKAREKCVSSGPAASCLLEVGVCFGEVVQDLQTWRMWGMSENSSNEHNLLGGPIHGNCSICCKFHLWQYYEIDISSFK